MLQCDDANLALWIIFTAQERAAGLKKGGEGCCCEKGWFKICKYNLKGTLLPISCTGWQFVVMFWLKHFIAWLGVLSSNGITWQRW